MALPIGSPYMPQSTAIDPLVAGTGDPFVVPGPIAELGDYLGWGDPDAGASSGATVAVDVVDIPIGPGPQLPTPPPTPTPNGAISPMALAAGAGAVGLLALGGIGLVAWLATRRRS